LSESFKQRGGLWVIGQSVLMTGVLALGVTFCGHWSGPMSAIVGWVAALAGAWLGIAGARVLGRSRTAFPKPPQEAALVQTGVYGFVRHPLYASVILLALAWSVLWRSVPALAMTALLMGFLDAKARREERWLREVFADYPDYAKRVRRLIPWLY
jgi:protein-S-isoprenylcysteine O-methyltransferase Ste14